jgi:hypothetical protein
MCKLYGQFLFNDNLLSSSDDAQILNLKKSEISNNVFSLKVFSDDPYCPINIKADVLMKDDIAPFQGLVYYFYVFFFFMFIVGSGFKIIFQSMRGGDFNKKLSLYLVATISCMDFYFTLDFFLVGK